MRRGNIPQPPDGNYPDPNSDTHYIYCVAHTHAYSVACAENTDGTLLHYVANSGPNPETSYSDRPEVAGSQDTTLTAGTAHVSGVPLAVRGLTAKVEWDGKPVNFARVIFTDADGRELARGYTGPDGNLTRDSGPLPSTRAELEQRLTTLKHGYTATFTGGGSEPGLGWQSSTGQGTINTVDAGSVD